MTCGGLVGPRNVLPGTVVVDGEKGCGTEDGETAGTTAGEANPQSQRRRLATKSTVPSAAIARIVIQ